jgi:putative transposase
MVLSHLYWIDYFRAKAMQCLKGYSFSRGIILQAIYFKLRFSLSYRDVEELLSIRGVCVDHATIQRWVYKFTTPFMEITLQKIRKRVGNS